MDHFPPRCTGMTRFMAPVRGCGPGLGDSPMANVVPHGIPRPIVRNERRSYYHRLVRVHTYPVAPLAGLKRSGVVSGREIRNMRLLIVISMPSGERTPVHRATRLTCVLWVLPVSDRSLTLPQHRCEHVDTGQ